MAVPVLHRDTHHARQAPDGEPMRELDQIQHQTVQLLQSMLGASPFAGVGTWVPAVDTRRAGRFEYRVTLPGPIDPDSIDASLDDGILRVTVPKPEQARPRRVVIQTPSGNGAPAEPAATT